ncbi:MAG TPA: hypothetical protein VGG29_19330 [Caulobacteraceae bacterium]|jgi:hypothetical protein
MLRVMLLAAIASGAAAGPALAHGHHRWASARAAQDWRVDTAARMSEEAALNPYGGPTLIASRPVPDTWANRARFGQPLSRAGKLTAPIGD